MTENKQPIPKGRDYKQAVGMLRQFINEERRDKLVTSEDIHFWLDKAVEADKQAAVRNALLIYNPGIHAEEIESVLAALDQLTNGDTK